MIKVEIIKDSINKTDNRLTTIKGTVPRIVLAEFNTHRMISRNSASSRAIPFEVMLKNVMENPFIPIKWLKEHKGMQGFDYWQNGSDEALKAEQLWLRMRKNAVEGASNLSSFNITKQFANRMIEPYMYHTIIATATEWENFFALRAHPMAEIHIQEFAHQFLEVYNKSEPQSLEDGEWHIPFEELINEVDLINYIVGGSASDLEAEEYDDLIRNHLPVYKAKISAAICAGISYGRIKEVTNFADLIDMHDSLVLRPYVSKFHRGTRSLNDPIHASPVEHQAMASSGNGFSGNLKGFIQYRKTFGNENAVDRRIIKKYWTK